MKKLRQSAVERLAKLLHYTCKDGAQFLDAFVRQAEQHGYALIPPTNTKDGLAIKIIFDNAAFLQEPRRLFVNIYPDHSESTSHMHSTKEKAIAVAASDALEIGVEFVEVIK